MIMIFLVMWSNLLMAPAALQTVRQANGRRTKYWKYPTAVAYTAIISILEKYFGVQML